MPAELLPCPFCGYTVSLDDGGYKGESDGEDRYSIVCPDCAQASAVDGSLEGVVKLWNRRAKLGEEKLTASNKRSTPLLCRNVECDYCKLEWLYFPLSILISQILLGN